MKKILSDDAKNNRVIRVKLQMHTLRDITNTELENMKNRRIRFLKIFARNGKINKNRNRFQNLKNNIQDNKNTIYNTNREKIKNRSLIGK